VKRLLVSTILLLGLTLTSIGCKQLQQIYANSQYHAIRINNHKITLLAQYAVFSYEYEFSPTLQVNIPGVIVSQNQNVNVIIDCTHKKVRAERQVERYDLYFDKRETVASAKFSQVNNKDRELLEKVCEGAAKDVQRAVLGL